MVMFQDYKVSHLFKKRKAPTSGRKCFEKGKDADRYAFRGLRLIILFVFLAGLRA